MFLYIYLIIIGLNFLFFNLDFYEKDNLKILFIFGLILCALLLQIELQLSSLGYFFLY